VNIVVSLIKIYLEMDRTQAILLRIGQYTDAWMDTVLQKIFSPWTGEACATFLVQQIQIMKKLIEGKRIMLRAKWSNVQFVPALSLHSCVDIAIIYFTIIAHSSDRIPVHSVVVLP